MAQGDTSNSTSKQQRDKRALARTNERREIKRKAKAQAKVADADLDEMSNPSKLNNFTQSLKLIADQVGIRNIVVQFERLTGDQLVKVYWTACFTLIALGSLLTLWILFPQISTLLIRLFEIAYNNNTDDTPTSTTIHWPFNFKPEVLLCLKDVGVPPLHRAMYEQRNTKILKFFFSSFQARVPQSSLAHGSSLSTCIVKTTVTSFKALLHCVAPTVVPNP